MHTPYVGYSDQQYNDSSDGGCKSILVVGKHSKMASTNIAVVSWREKKTEWIRWGIGQDKCTMDGTGVGWDRFGMEQVQDGTGLGQERFWTGQVWDGTGVGWDKCGMGQVWDGTGVGWDRCGMGQVWDGTGVGWDKVWDGTGVGWDRFGMGQVMYKNGWDRYGMGQVCIKMDGGVRGV